MESLRAVSTVVTFYWKPFAQAAGRPTEPDSVPWASGSFLGRVHSGSHQQLKNFSGVSLLEIVMLMMSQSSREEVRGRLMTWNTQPEPFPMARGTTFLIEPGLLSQGALFQCPTHRKNRVLCPVTRAESTLHFVSPPLISPLHSDL